MNLENFIFSPIYTIGHTVGTIIVKIISMLSGILLPDIIVDTIGILTIVTVLLILVDVARRITWSIVTICWALLIMRIGLLMIGE